MASLAFWTWVNDQGLTPDSDPNWYASGQAAQESGAYTNAIKVAIQNVKNKPLAVQLEFFRRLQAEGGMSPESRSSYYSEIDFANSDMQNLITSAGSAFEGRYGTGASTQALPRNSRLVKIGNQYRVVWNLGDNLGHAWYSISPDQLNKLYGTTTPTAAVTLSNTGQFDAQFKGVYWGDASEISLKAETPWEDLKQKMFSQFGFVPGLDDLDVKRLLVQSYFEGWSQDQFFVEYRNTNFYKSTTDEQRKWSGLSPIEQSQRIADANSRLSQRYRDIWGRDPEFNYINHKAMLIASGQLTEAQFIYEESTSAAKQTGTPEYARRFEERRAALEPGNRAENLSLFAEQQYRSWVGPGAIPQNFASQWGGRLASGEASEADLESYLKKVSQSQWSFKPPDITWEDWAAGYKSQIGQTLELGSVDDADPLLNKILRSDLTGVDLQTMIRSDQRFKATQTMFQELAGVTAEMGRRFGFVT